MEKTSDKTLDKIEIAKFNIVFLPLQSIRLLPYTFIARDIWKSFFNEKYFFGNTNTSELNKQKAPIEVYFLWVKGV